MTDLDDRVRRALDAQHAPEALRARTLKAIEEARTQQQAAAPGEDFDEAEEYGEDYGGGEYDDLPPWDEEETEGSE